MDKLRLVFRVCHNFRSNSLKIGNLGPLKGTLSYRENFWYVKTACFCIPNIYFLFWNSPRNTPKIRKNCQFLSRKVTKMASMAPKKSINSCQWLQNLEKIGVNGSANLEKNRVNDSRNWNKTVSTAPKSGKKWRQRLQELP